MAYLKRPRRLLDEQGRETKYYAELVVAERLGVCRHSLKNWREAGLVPEPRRHGKRLLYTTGQVKLLVGLAKRIEDRNRYRDAYSIERVRRWSLKMFKEWER